MPARSGAVAAAKRRQRPNSAAPLTVGCTQEAPLFSEEAAESGRANPIQFANIRESAGWSSEAAEAGPKMAALLAAAAEPAPPVSSVKLESGGVILICGRDEIAVEAGNLLKDHLDVTVLIEPPADIAPPRISDFPVAKGKVRNARGHFGAQPVPLSGRQLLKLLAALASLAMMSCDQVRGDIDDTSWKNNRMLGYMLITPAASDKPSQ
jgi:hypothetical protein